MNQILQPSVEVRLGLRYVNQITHPPIKASNEWTGLIAEGFLGPLAIPNLAEGTDALESRVIFDLGDGLKCLLRHGSFADTARPGLLTYLIDTDCYRELGVRFNRDEVLATSDRLNDLAVSLFQQVTTPRLREAIAAQPEVLE